MRTDVAIVGAGITGLSLCDAVTRRGVECVVFEAKKEPGGVIRSVLREGRVLELGPQRTRLTPRVRSLVERVGLESRLLEAPADLAPWIYHGGELHRLPTCAAELLRSGLLSWRGKARLLLEPLHAPPRADESAAEALTRKFGHEAYRRVLGPLLGSIYASDPERMPVTHSLGPLWRAAGLGRSALAGALRRRVRGGRAPACTFRDGLQELPRALYEAHTDRVRLGARARRVRRAGDAFRVETTDGEVGADTVVLTVPADAAAGLLEELAPEAARRLARLAYGEVTLVHLVADCPLRGYGHQVSFEETGFVTSGATWNHSLFGRDGLYTAYLSRSPGDGRNGRRGGDDRRRWSELDPDAAARTAAAEFTRVTGCEARPVHVHRARMPAHDGSWEELTELRRRRLLPAGVHLCANYESRPGIPGRVRRAEALAGELS